MLRLVAVAAATGAALVLALPGSATAPPVGPLPKGPVTAIRAGTGSLVAVALPRRSGRVWRLAHGVSPKVLAEVSEANVGKDVVVVYRAAASGRARLVYGLTRGETSRADASLTFAVTVAGR